MRTRKLNRNNDFRRAYKRGESLVGRCVVIYVVKTRLPYNRMGVTVSKKLGGAVVRNRVRRLITESFRLSEERLKTGYDFVFVGRTRCVNAKMQKVKESMDALFLKHGLFVSESPISADAQTR